MTVVAVASLAGWLDVVNAGADRAVAEVNAGVISGLVGLVVVFAGAVVLQHRPRHAVGRVLVGAGLLWAVDGLGESWIARSYGTDLPGTDLAVWVVARLGAYLLTMLPLLLVIYPSGRLPTGRLRRVAIGVVLAAAALPTALLLAPDEVVLRDPALPGVRTDLLALPVSEDVAVAVLTAATPVTLLALFGALLVVGLRHRVADPEERVQLRWLLWAGLVDLLSVVAVLLLSPGTLAGLVLAAALIVTAVSVTVGIVRPDLADVDALVAGTVTHAGVAAVVLGLDAALLALAESAMGDTLDRREVTLLVLVVAVAVYGPLRMRLGRAVRRLLFGERGDRYDVVSRFAARLEEVATVSEQLPALAAAVATTFKLPSVRVEVVVPDGATLTASHGPSIEHANEVDIAYRGERVGRLVLPRRGLRSLLSAADQALLVDLVRQAAVAVRASLLAEALQESRERLVLGREEDRRRIRRDLHDGLGPALGGVGLLLEAAGHAVDRDPARATSLLRQARAEVGQAMDDVRLLVHDLRPPALDDLGLVAAVEQQAERARGRLAVEVVAGELGTLPAAVEVAAYRIVAEALTNVVRHADARHCTIHLRRSGPDLRVEVRDDGHGIAEDVRAGIGLRSLRERAEELGGHCEVTCPAEGGTCVIARMPFAAAPALTPQSPREVARG